MTGKQRILKAALQLFAEQGYTESRTSEIARHAEISEPMIFKHFQSKQNLLRELVRESYELHENMVQDVLDKNPDELDRIEGLIRGVIDLARKNRHHCLLMERVCAFKRNDQDFPCQRAANTSIEMLRDNLEQAVRTGVEQGRFVHLNPEASAEAFMAMALGASRLHSMGRNPNHETSEALIQCIRSRLLPQPEVPAANAG